MNPLRTRPAGVTLAAGLILLYALAFILWDLVSPFERPYAQGPVSVIFGIRVFGLWAQLLHGVQFAVALLMAYGLWTMQRWGWHLLLLVAGYMLVSNVVWVVVYQEFERIFFSVFYLAIVVLLLVLTYPYRKTFV